MRGVRAPPIDGPGGVGIQQKVVMVFLGVSFGAGDCQPPQHRRHEGRDNNRLRRPSTKSDPSQGKIRTFLKLTSGQVAYIAPTFLPRRRRLPPAFFVGKKFLEKVETG